jgi:hypothetical protein
MNMLVLLITVAGAAATAIKTTTIKIRPAQLH